LKSAVGGKARGDGENETNDQQEVEDIDGNPGDVVAVSENKGLMVRKVVEKGDEESEPHRAASAGSSVIG
jgi:hypothetical protein